MHAFNVDEILKVKKILGNKTDTSEKKEFFILVFPPSLTPALEYATRPLTSRHFLFTPVSIRLPFAANLRFLWLLFTRGMLDNLIGAFQLFVGAPPLSPRLPGRKQIFSRSIALRIFPRFYARIIRFSRTKMTDERGAGVRRRAGKGQCNGSGRRCLGLSLDLGLDLSTFAIVPEAIPY